MQTRAVINGKTFLSLVILNPHTRGNCRVLWPMECSPRYVIGVFVVHLISGSLEKLLQLS